MNKESIIIGIAGGSGSGKSTFTNRIKERFGDKVVVIYHDNYYPELPLAFLNLNGHKVKYLVCRMAMAILLHNSFLFPATYITTSRKY